MPWFASHRFPEGLDPLHAQVALHLSMPCFFPRLFALYSQNESYPRAVTLLHTLTREAFAQKPRSTMLWSSAWRETLHHVNRPRYLAEETCSTITRLQYKILCAILPPVHCIARE